MNNEEIINFDQIYDYFQPNSEVTYVTSNTEVPIETTDIQCIGTADLPIIAVNNMPSAEPIEINNIGNLLCSWNLESLTELFNSK